MKIAVIGAGAIGSLIAGYLKLNNENVFLVARSDALRAIKKDGLRISGVRGDFKVEIPSGEQLESSPELAILATKTQDLDAAIARNLNFLNGSIVLTTQNGISADGIATKYIPKESLLISIVMFGATYLEPARVVHNFEGKWVLGSAFQNSDPHITRIRPTLEKVFPTVVSPDIAGMKYLKIFVNANNCIPAILGMSMQEAFSDIDTGKIALAIWREGLNVVNKSGRKLVSLPDFPLERLTKLSGMPDAEAAKIFCGIMTGLSKEPLYGSILQSIKRARPSEIDYINGEFVRMAKDHGSEAPLNAKLTEMVHQVERTGIFFSREDLLNSARTFLN